VHQLHGEATARSYENPLVAAEEYGAIERAIEGQSGKDAVLVSVESLSTEDELAFDHLLASSLVVASDRGAR
jgi:hypothetical protein